MATKETFALKAACGFHAEVCSSALLIPAILGREQTEPPLFPRYEFARPALTKYVMYIQNGEIQKNRRQNEKNSTIESGKIFNFHAHPCQSTAMLSITLRQLRNTRELVA
jgi:hypothetical protein